MGTSRSHLTTPSFFFTYFLLLKNKQPFAPCNQSVEFLSNSSSHKRNMYKTWLNSLETFCKNKCNYPEHMCKILLCDCYQNARKSFLRRKCIRRPIFQNIEYFFILQYFRKISGTKSVSEDDFRTQNIFFYSAIF